MPTRLNEESHAWVLTILVFVLFLDIFVKELSYVKTQIANRIHVGRAIGCHCDHRDAADWNLPVAELAESFDACE